jgi:hypothetical protein
MGPTGGGVAGGAVASRAALKGVGATSRYDGQLVLVKTDGSMWRFVAASIVEADGADELAIAPTSGTGMWLRADKSFVMKLPIDHTMSDGQEICEIPAGMAVKLAAEPFWEVTTGWTGGSSASIGIASSQTGYNTAGDLLGGAAGELTAVLGTTGVKPGTIGPHVDTLVERQALVMVSGDTITYEKIADTYGAGAGFVCIPVLVATVAGG